MGVALRRLAVVFVAFVIGANQALAQGACPVRPAKPFPDLQPTKLTDAYWLGRVRSHEQDLARLDLSKVGLLMLGDSLIEAWAPPVQQLFYGHRGFLNLGVGGDNTQGMLWRIGRLRQTNLRPKLIVLLIGTNNIWPGRPADEVAVAIAEVLRQIRAWTPESRILLLGLLPRGSELADPTRQVQQRVNLLIAPCADGVSVFYADPGALLLDGNGVLPDRIVPDHLHPNWIGYGILSAAIEPQLRLLLHEAVR
jgi:beta-glucosidase